VVKPRLAAEDPDATVIRGLPPQPLPKRQLALPPGLQLHEYRIERVLGQGGFGITYLATDANLSAEVAIKEYLPEEIAFRASDRSVSPNASQHRDRYQQGLENFLAEARTLASFRHPNIVRVARFFEAHHTAYMVLEYERGRSFKVVAGTDGAGPGAGRAAAGAAAAAAAGRPVGGARRGLPAPRHQARQHPGARRGRPPGAAGLRLGQPDA
jgi:hypothetical protein